MNTESKLTELRMTRGGCLGVNAEGGSEHVKTAVYLYAGELELDMYKGAPIKLLLLSGKAEERQTLNVLVRWRL